MDLVAVVFFKIISVLLNVIIGYIGGKSGKLEGASIASLLLNFLCPIVFFAIPASSNITFTTMSISFLMFVIACSLCLLTYVIASKYYTDGTANILAMSAGTGNTGYFMLPIAAFLFDDYTLTIYTMSVIGLNVYEASLGYYMCARSVSSMQESLMTVLKLPMLHAFVLGCIFSIAGFSVPDFLDDFIYNARSAYSMLGMVMIGISVSKIKHLKIDYRFLGISFCSKFVFYPLAIATFIFLDKNLFGWYNYNYYVAFKLIGIAPIAASTIMISSVVGAKTDNSVSAVILSCLFVLVYVPFMVYLWGVGVVVNE